MYSPLLRYAGGSGRERQGIPGKVDRPVEDEPAAEAAPVAGVRKRAVEESRVAPEPVRRRGVVERHAIPRLLAYGIACNKRTAARGRHETCAHAVEESRRAV